MKAQRWEIHLMGRDWQMFSLGRRLDSQMTSHCINLWSCGGWRQRLKPQKQITLGLGHPRDSPWEGDMRTGPMDAGSTWPTNKPPSPWARQSQLNPDETGAWKNTRFLTAVSDKALSALNGDSHAIEQYKARRFSYYYVELVFSCHFKGHKNSLLPSAAIFPLSLAHCLSLPLHFLCGLEHNPDLLGTSNASTYQQGRKTQWVLNPGTLRNRTNNEKLKGSNDKHTKEKNCIIANHSQRPSVISSIIPFLITFTILGSPADIWIVGGWHVNRWTTIPSNTRFQLPWHAISQDSC